MAISDNPFQEKVGLNQFSGLENITGAFPMGNGSGNALVVRENEGRSTVYEFSYSENDVSAEIQTKPVFEWDRGGIRFTALKKEESWGVVVTEQDRTFFFQFDPSAFDY